MTRLGTVALAVMVALCSVEIAPGCPFCGPGGETLTQKAGKASMVLYGKLTNANEDADTTDLEIDEVIIDHEKRDKTKQKLTIARYLDTSVLTDKERFLVFCDFYKGKIDPYHGMVVKKGSKMPEYMRGAIKLKDKSATDRLKFFFEYLDSSDQELSSDAYWEFANSTYDEFRPMAKGLPVERVVKWLKDPETPVNRLGLYASMLGHSGSEKDADVLKAILDDPDRRNGSGLDGVFAAYTLLSPKQGFARLKESMKDTKGDFGFRYAALKAMRFLHELRPDVISKGDLEDAVGIMLAQDDIGDLAIEDLRKWQAWGQLDKVLAVKKTEAYKVPIIRRAVLRFCLQCEGKPAAKAHVEERKKIDAEEVERAISLLALETDTQKKAKK